MAKITVVIKKKRVEILILNLGPLKTIPFLLCRVVPPPHALYTSSTLTFYKGSESREQCRGASYLMQMYMIFRENLAHG